MFKFKLQDGATPFEFPEEVPKAGLVLADAFMRSGYVDDDMRLDWTDLAKAFSPKTRDATSTPDIHNLLQVSTQVLIREPVEPLMNITGLFTKIASRGLQQQVLLGAIGAVEADDIAEGEEYPEVMFNVGGGMQTVLVGKSGLQASFTQEALHYSTWDIWSMNMRAMANALMRHKEHKAVSFLRSLGVELFNNASPQTSVFGVTTGRGLDMAPNGTLRMKDLMRAMAHMAEEGFHPDTILVNPQFFYTFVQDPVLRTMMLNTGSGDWFRPWSGTVGPLDPWSNGAMGSMGPSMGNQITRAGSPAGGTPTGIAGREHGMTSAPSIPTDYFPWSMRVIVSPFVHYDQETDTGDIILLKSGSVGYLLQDEEPIEVRWEDYSRDILKVKMRERYVFAMVHEGQAVGVLKNVKNDDNHFTGVVQAMTMDVTGEVDASTPIAF